MVDKPKPMTPMEGWCIVKPDNNAKLGYGGMPLVYCRSVYVKSDVESICHPGERVVLVELREKERDAH